MANENTKTGARINSGFAGVGRRISLIEWHQGWRDGGQYADTNVKEGWEVRVRDEKKKKDLANHPRGFFFVCFCSLFFD